MASRLGDKKTNLELFLNSSKLPLMHDLPQQNVIKQEPEEIKKMLADSFCYHNKKKTEKLEEKIPSSSIPWDVIDTDSEDSEEQVFCQDKKIGVDEDDE